MSLRTLHSWGCVLYLGSLGLVSPPLDCLKPTLIISLGLEWMNFLEAPFNPEILMYCQECSITLTGLELTITNCQRAP